ncbi:hypothetical protein ACFFX0_18360 [Citricoccus parietis]|uniref:Uncharacterized protein n=1 Tax=Citricoccus parietis TaxID=592307 RepID=A0ABV5G2C3_9MICC
MVCTGPSAHLIGHRLVGASAAKDGLCFLRREGCGEYARRPG